MFFLFVLGIVLQIYGIKFEFCRKPMIICEKLLTSSLFGIEVNLLLNKTSRSSVCMEIKAKTG